MKRSLKETLKELGVACFSLDDFCELVKPFGEELEELLSTVASLLTSSFQYATIEIAYGVEGNKICFEFLVRTDKLENGTEEKLEEIEEMVENSLLQTGFYPFVEIEIKVFPCTLAIFAF